MTRLPAPQMSYVIAGPVDPEDGTLYWSNEDGWGFLSTATVFTAAEHAEGNLPVGDDARWAALPAGEQDWLLMMHQMLYPERYPRDVQPDHVYWADFDPSEDAEIDWRRDEFQWDSETIEWVALSLESALQGNPKAVLS